MDNPDSVVAKKILIVDDDESLLSVYGEKFKGEGFDVATAKDGQEAWDLISGGYRPDVMFTGISMPRMDGFDLIRKMQTDPKLAAIPVAISSHRGREIDRTIAKSLGVDDFLVRGFVNLNEVVRRIQVMIGMRDRYVVPLRRNEGDAEALINLLDKQQMTSLGFDGKDLFLEFSPQSERGTFIVKLSHDRGES